MGLPHRERVFFIEKGPFSGLSHRERALLTLFSRGMPAGPPAQAVTAIHAHVKSKHFVHKSKHFHDSFSPCPRGDVPARRFRRRARPAERGRADGGVGLRRRCGREQLPVAAIRTGRQVCSRAAPVLATVGSGGGGGGQRSSNRAAAGMLTCTASPVAMT